MNRILLSILLYLFFSVCVHANVRVLSIGVSDYPETSGWNKLNAHNDVELMRSIFPDAILLENVSATRSGIEAQLKALALNAAIGDTVIIHFSGHGQQIITINSADEIDRVEYFVPKGRSDLEQRLSLLMRLVLMLTLYANYIMCPPTILRRMYKKLSEEY